MDKLSNKISTVKFLSYLFFASGLIYTVIDFTNMFRNAVRPNLGALIGYGALMAVGLIGAVIGSSLREFHRRIRLLEEERQQQPKR